MARDDGAEVVVEQHDRGDLARAARAALAHRDADVGRLQRRHVVHAVAGDRDDLATPLQRAHQAELLRRHGARDDVAPCRGRRAPPAARRCSISAALITCGALPPSPISRATARAVSGWSPVTMIVWMPACAAERDRVGDALAHRVLEASRPARSKPRSRLAAGPASPSSGCQAQAITLCPSLASASTRVDPRAPASPLSSVAIARITSGDALGGGEHAAGRGRAHDRRFAPRVLGERKPLAAPRAGRHTARAAASQDGSVERIAAVAAARRSPRASSSRALVEALGRHEVGEPQAALGDRARLVGADAR